MRIVSAQELENWLANGRILEKDARGLKVIQLTDGRLLKIFRPRRRIWLARLLPQARRFASNALRLQALQVPVPHISETFWIARDEAVSACLYEPLPGQSLAHLLRDDPSALHALLPAFARFILALHQRGIYFRSLHLGNVLLLPDGRFGLIDFLDLRLQERPLSTGQVKRNLNHLHSYLQRSRTHDFPWQALLDAYHAASQQAAA